MTDHKFTDDEVIKALECCKQPIPMCHSCPIGEGDMCFDFMKEKAISIINRQKAEIERLKKIGDDKTSEVLRHDASIRELHKQLETAKAEAIKEFAERLYDNIKYIPDEDLDIEYEINNLVKEMTEENNESQNT